MSDPLSPTKEKRRKLKALVITMPGSDRQNHIQNLFRQPCMSRHFEPPAFSDGVPSRDLKNRFQFMNICYRAGLIPNAEWEAIKVGHADPKYQRVSEHFFHALDDLKAPVIPGRRGSEADVQLHYCVELWRKSKTINRGRAVLGCTLAHLIALKERFFQEEFDVILEDNIRAPLNGECAERIWQSMEAMHEWEAKQRLLQQQSNSPETVPTKCHFRFLGWLGSVPNINWIYERHTLKQAFQREKCNDPMAYTVMPFPNVHDILQDLQETEPLEEFNKNDDVPGLDEDEQAGDIAEKTAESQRKHTKPGGNPVWGSYAYWISKEGYNALLQRLQTDVGALLWKGKRMRFYIVKPADKMLPRVLIEHFGYREAVQLSTYPAFFRAPMLTSKIHTKWDPEFCKSTEFQLSRAGGLTWADLWLTEEERAIIAHQQEHGEWITLGRLLQIRQEAG